MWTTTPAYSMKEGRQHATTNHSGRQKVGVREVCVREALKWATRPLYDQWYVAGIVYRVGTTFKSINFESLRKAWCVLLEIVRNKDRWSKTMHQHDGKRRYTRALR